MLSAKGPFILDFNNHTESLMENAILCVEGSFTRRDSESETFFFNVCCLYFHLYCWLVLKSAY